MISACIAVKNRADNLKRCVESLEKCPEITEIVVSDFNSDDTDFAWYNHKLVKINDPYFSVGKGRNVAAANATNDILFFVDADMTVPPELTKRILEVVNSGKIYSPICWFWENKEHTEGRWADSGLGLIALKREEFFQNEPYKEWTSYGGEDDVFYLQYYKRAVREKVDGFIHHWHPHELRTKYSENEALHDLEKYKKETGFE